MDEKLESAESLNDDQIEEMYNQILSDAFENAKAEDFKKELPKKFIQEKDENTDPEEIDDSNIFKLIYLLRAP